MNLMLQEFKAKEWGGLTTKNHLGAIFGIDHQKASNLVTMVFQANSAYVDLGTYLQSIATPLYLDTDDAFVWDLMAKGDKNIPLQACLIDGVEATVTDRVGFNYSEFTFVFAEPYFFDVNIIVGHRQEYQIQILDDPMPYNTMWAYRCQLVTGDPNLFIPFEELVGKRYSKLFSGVESTMSKKGGKVNYTSPFKMKNYFSRIRMQDDVPGNMISRPMGVTIGVKGKDGSIKKTNLWQDVRDWTFEEEYRKEKNNMLYYARLNRAADGTFKNKGKSGFEYEQGAGLLQQIEASSLAFYPVNGFNIKTFVNILLDLSINRLAKDKRKFLVRTGERGMIQASEAIARYGEQFFTPIASMNQFISVAANGDASFKGQFKSFKGPNGVEFEFVVDPMKDDTTTHKILHPMGGPAESYTYDIYDIGTTDGEPNLRLVYQKGMEDIKGYEPGLRNPFSPQGAMSIMANSTDAYTHHRMFIGGAMVKDPTKCFRYKCNLLA